MWLSLPSNELAVYTASQLNTFFPDGKTVGAADLRKPQDLALDRTEHCFGRINSRAYCDGGCAKFDVLYSDQYCSYLYFLANSVHRQEGDARLAAKLFCLNKALHGLNCMYDTELPAIFWFIHMVGAVLGKATYSDFLVVRQNCTIGALGAEYPVLGAKLIMSAGSSIIGRCVIGENVMLGPGCTVLKTDIPANSLVTAGSDWTVRPNSDRAARVHFTI